MNEIFKALSDPTRRKVLELLRRRPMTAGEIAGHFVFSKPTMSAHFAVLRGEDRGAHRDCLLLGTALALEVAGLSRDPREGVARAVAAIDEGAAGRLLESLPQQRSLAAAARSARAPRESAQ